MTKAEKALLKRGFIAIDRKLKAIEKSQIMMYNDVQEDIRNILLVLEETQAQQRRSSVTMRVSDAGPGPTRGKSTGRNR